MKIKNNKLEFSFIGDPIFKKFLKEHQIKLKILMKYFKSLHHIEGSSLVCIKIVSEDEIRTLNKKFRKKNKLTDVISFGDEGFSGDIAITKTYIFNKNQYLSQNFFMLLTHGLLHLFGYTHYDKSSRSAMRILENLCMRSIGLKDTHEI